MILAWACPFKYAAMIHQIERRTKVDSRTKFVRTPLGMS